MKEKLRNSKKWMMIVFLLILISSLVGCSELGINRDDLIFLFLFIVIHASLSFILYLINPTVCFIGAFFQVYMMFNTSSSVLFSPQWLLDHLFTAIHPDIHYKFMFF